MFDKKKKKMDDKIGWAHGRVNGVACLLLGCDVSVRC
jgi:hypothetical protein